jgi:glycine hydroxymethyltransferase
MKENEMKLIAKVFAGAVKNHNNEEKLVELKNEILDLCKKFPIYKK